MPTGTRVPPSSIGQRDLIGDATAIQSQVTTIVEAISCGLMIAKAGLGEFHISRSTPAVCAQAPPSLPMISTGIDRWKSSPCKVFDYNW